MAGVALIGGDAARSLRAWLRSAGARGGAVLGAAMLLAGALDYGVSIVAGRWLDPVDFGAFVSIVALLQVTLSLATAIRMVVAFRVAALGASGALATSGGAFLRSAARWCGTRGLLAAAIVAAAAPVVARALRIGSAWPVRAAALMVLMLFLREAALGALQGIQAFERLAAVQVGQAILRLGLAAALVALGAGLTGAVVAQPLAAVGAVALACAWLRPRVGAGARASEGGVGRAYSLAAVAGLTLFALLTNLDALFVKLAYAPRVAGDYGTVVTFEKINLFLPSAVSFVLFPKAARRHAAGQDARPILLVALAAAIAPGVALTAVYAAAPGLLVRTVFTDAYANPGAVLALAALAASLHAGVNIWLSYALATSRTGFVWALAAAVAWQGGAMFLFGRESLARMAVVMLSAALAANVGGWLTTWSPARTAAARGAVARGAGVAG